MTNKQKPKLIEINRPWFIIHKFKSDSNKIKKIAYQEQQESNIVQSNLFSLRLVNLGELVPVPIDLVERGRVFWQRWRWNGPGSYRWLFVRFVATVDAGRNGGHWACPCGPRCCSTGRSCSGGIERTRLEVCHVGTGRREDWLHRGNRRPRWLRWRRCTHIFIILLLANTL